MWIETLTRVDPFFSQNNDNPGLVHELKRARSWLQSFKRIPETGPQETQIASAFLY